jgi:thioredoxin reductase
LTQDGVRPASLLKDSRQQISRYSNATIAAKTALKIEPAADGFAVNFAGGSAHTSRTVLIATGVVDELPPLPGFETFFGRSVHVCPYCDGWEHRNAPVAVYGRGEKGAAFANLLRQWTSDLVLCTDGESLAPDLVTKLRERGIETACSAVERLEGADGCLSAVVFRDGERLPRKALFFTTGQHPRSPLLVALGCLFDDKGGAACDAEGRTSVAGIYVAGDVFPGRPACNHCRSGRRKSRSCHPTRISLVPSRNPRCPLIVDFCHGQERE